MADESQPAAPVKSARDLSEEYIGKVLDGFSPCGLTNHPALTDLDCLVLLRHLRIRFPHQSTLLSELDQAIRRELRKLREKKK